MKLLAWLGAAVLLLGIASLVIPIPHRERHGVTVGDLSLGVVTQNDQRVPLAVSVAMILGGIAVAALGLKTAK